MIFIAIQKQSSTYKWACHLIVFDFHIQRWGKKSSHCTCKLFDLYWTSRCQIMFPFKCWNWIGLANLMLQIILFGMNELTFYELWRKTILYVHYLFTLSFLLLIIEATKVFFIFYLLFSYHLKDIVFIVFLTNL